MIDLRGFTKVKITLKGSKNWAVIDETNALGLRGKSEKFPSQPYVESDVDQAIEVSVGAGQGRAVSFPVVPQTLGQVPIEVRAQSASNADAVRRNLLVEVINMMMMRLCTALSFFYASFFMLY